MIGPDEIRGTMQAVSRLVTSAVQQIDNADIHFAQHPPGGRVLSDDEIELMLARRKAVVALRSIRDAAGQVLQATGSSSPLPYGAVEVPEGCEG